MIPFSQFGQQSERVNLVEAVPLPFPLSVFIEPTNICNLRCSFCAHTFDDYKERAGYLQVIDMDLYRNLIEQLREMGLKTLRLFFFGEPLIHPHIGEICRLATTVCPRVELTTNGMLLTLEKAREIIASGCSYVRISAYQDIPCPEKVIEKVRILRQLRDDIGSSLPFISVKVFTPEEKKSVEPAWEGVSDEVYCDGFHTMGSDLVHIGTYTGQNRACTFPFYNMVIKANGDVVPCCVAWEKSLVIGNANKQTLLEIWNGEQLRRIQRLHLQGRRGELAACEKCDTLHTALDSVDALTAEEFDRRLA